MKTKILIITLSFLIFSVVIQAQTNDSTEFDEFNNVIEKIDTSKTNNNDEFGGEDDEFGNEDEFGSNDEFSSGDASENFNNNVADDAQISYNRLYWALAVLAYTILAGVFVRFNATRKLRGLFLMLGLVILGFYRGGHGVV